MSLEPVNSSITNSGTHTTILFLDDWQLSSITNMDRKVGKPKWIREGTLVDGLTEGTWNFPLVVYEPDLQLWKAVYCGAVDFEPVRANKNRFLRNQILLYAESSDGVHWVKKDVSDQASFPGKRYAANQVFGLDEHCDGAPVFYDLHERDPERRWKYFFASHRKQFLAVSPDAIHWKVEAIPLDEVTLDSPITCFYNDVKGTYVLSRRVHNGDRRIALFETMDFRTFTQPEIVIHPEPHDPPLVQFYGMPVYKYEHLFMGLLWMFHTNPGEIEYHKDFGPIDCSLAYSMDGRHFFRALHEPFIPRNERGEHGGGSIYTSTMLQAPDGHLRFYSGGSKAEHFQDQNLDDAALLLHELRKDGFFYLESHAMIGRVMTRCVDFGGNGLNLNVRAPYGRIRVQLSEAQGKPHDGFAFDDCVPFCGDTTAYSPVWKSGRLPSALHGIRTHIEVEVTSGELYAIRGDFEIQIGSK
ncbi:hypothetical protein OB236_28055 [Paenibacillus sp. WQ 127069]|uniref:Glycosyl hydrolase family 32 N-terminal domain-containing protein n=1 Tax=Paenibacillus baimaensis TaxID=2982185 RepID=A0ABT2UMU8_9BACL|nr:hypothetical protein [Paenibacillus sp. WQ 127069]MCU6795980.1 hypothetical protein [Paenibacillus sp. WQ 127069]